MASRNCGGCGRPAVWMRSWGAILISICAGCDEVLDKRADAVAALDAVEGGIAVTILSSSMATRSTSTSTSCRGFPGMTRSASGRSRGNAGSDPQSQASVRFLSAQPLPLIVCVTTFSSPPSPRSRGAITKALQAVTKPLRVATESLRSRYEPLPSRYESLVIMEPDGSKELASQRQSLWSQPSSGGCGPGGCSPDAPATGGFSMVSPQYIRYAAGSKEEKRARGPLHGDMIAQ